MDRECKNISREQQRIQHDDEIDLVQVWLILWKRKYLIGIIFLLCSLLGFVFAYSIPAKYSYTTSIDIGTTLASSGSGVESRIIELPEVVLAKIKESYIPNAVAQMVQGNAGKSYAVQAKNPKKSNLVVLTSKGTADVEDSLRFLHNLVVEPILKDHRQVIAVPRKGYQIAVDQQKIQLQRLEDPRIFSIKEKEMQIQINAAKMKLDELDDQKRLFLSQDKRLTETQILLRSQVGTVEKNLDQVYASRPKATENVATESQAMTLLMINSQIEQNEKRLAQLQERLNIKLVDQKEVLQKNISTNRRAWNLQKDRISKLQSQKEELKIGHEHDVENQKNEIASIKNKIEGLRDTRTLSVATRSSNPIGPRKLLVLLLSGVLGMMGGILVAFFAVFIDKVQLQNQSNK